MEVRMTPEKLADLDKAIKALRTLTPGEQLEQDLLREEDTLADTFWGESVAKDEAHDAERPDYTLTTTNGPPMTAKPNNVWVCVICGKPSAHIAMIEMPEGYSKPGAMFCDQHWPPPDKWWRVDESTGEVLEDGERAVPQTPAASDAVTAQPGASGEATAYPDDTIEPLSVSHARRDAILTDRFTRLMALHGPGNKYQDARKITLAQARIRARVSKVGEKITEAYLDDLAHTDPDYVAFVDQGILEDAEVQMAKKNLQNIEDRIRRTDAVMRWRTAEARLAS
jgi:hypothetical protein